jgi:polysaccharide export outer membrane protein
LGDNFASAAEVISATPHARQEAVVLLAPRPIPDEEPTLALGTHPRPDEGSDCSTGRIVWRASPPSMDADPPMNDAPPPGRLRLLHRQPAPVSPVPQTNDLPRELNKVTLPPYRVEPPDILVINAFHLIAKPPYQIEPLDELQIQVPPEQVIPKEPIHGTYHVGPDGQVDLGFSYGKVLLAGLTPEQARTAIARHVADVHGIKAPVVTVALVQTRAPQPIRGEHLVRMDGTVSLGLYGDAYVAGLTLAEVKGVIEAQLSQVVLNPVVTVDVLANNSKVYYVIYDDRHGQQICKFPIAGGETVLDAISQLHCLPFNSCATRIWIARPVPGEVCYRQVIPVDWAAITQAGATKTNLEIFPGDRIYVRKDCGVSCSKMVDRVLSQMEHLCDFTGW